MQRVTATAIGSNLPFPHRLSLPVILPLPSSVEYSLSDDSNQQETRFANAVPTRAVSRPATARSLLRSPSRYSRATSLATRKNVKIAPELKLHSNAIFGALGAPHHVLEGFRLYLRSSTLPAPRKLPNSFAKLPTCFAKNGGSCSANLPCAFRLTLRNDSVRTA